MIQLYNSLTKQKEIFQSLKSGHVGMYNCGPTVYDNAHIGNLRSFILADTLRRVFEFNHYKVKQVMNFTDVGHLTSDADEGEDKMVRALKRQGKEMSLENMKEIAVHFANEFKSDLRALNFKIPHALPFASEHIDSQIKIIKGLEEKGFTYTTSDGVYFRVAKDANYGKLGGISEVQKTEARIDENKEKEDPRDFALWKFGEIGWSSPWGSGFPGWHIECSGMSMQYLGEQLDIHTGGIDNKPIHHNNEIAQTENYTGKRFANYWLHGEHLNLKGEKMAKSSGGFITLKTIIEKGFSPLAYRYLLLQTHYRSQANFSWEALESADTALDKLKRKSIDFHKNTSFLKQLFTKPDARYHEKFLLAINDDLDLPKALAVTWELVKDEKVNSATKLKTLIEFDKVLGLKLTYKDFAKNVHLKAPEDVQKLLDERKKAREQKDWKKSDELRDLIKEKGFEVKDGENGQEVIKIVNSK